jgi:hypothetical protein
MACELKTLPLGLPLTVASVGTIATLGAGKNLHAGFGIAWAALTFLHGWQHHKKMQADACKLFGCGKKAEKAAVEPVQALLDSFQQPACRQSPMAAGSGGLHQILYRRGNG